jgi:MYXO-CTERM domain-containing protein
MPTISWLSPTLLGTLVLALSTPAFACGEGGETNPAVCAVLCANGFDDDGDGYTDGYDSECTNLSTPECTEFTGTDPSFSMVREQRSTGAYDARHQVAAADLDHDGVVELVIGRGGYSTELSVINAQTMEEESRIPFASGSWQTFDPGPSLGQLDDGPLEVAWISGNGSSDFRLQVARLEGDEWQVAMSGNIRTLAPGAVINDNNTRGWAVSMADIDQDGDPELVAGNTVWSYNSTDHTIELLLDGSLAPGAACQGNNVSYVGYRAGMTVAMDILPDPGLEIAAGYQVYVIDTTGDSWTSTVVSSPVTRRDGFTSVADMDLDGDLDVVVATDQGMYVWDPSEQVELAWWPDNTGVYHGRPVVGEFYDADLADDGLINNSTPNYPDTLYVRAGELLAYSLNDTSAFTWRLATNDGSGATKAVVHDLNGDGIAEIIYRDEQTFRVMYGGPLANAPSQVNTTNRNYAATACRSSTRLEGPIVLDADSDGQSEVVLTCDGHLDRYGSGSAPWTPSRSVWNQYYYHVTNIENDGSIPANPQPINAEFPEGSGRYPLNVGMQQFNVDSVLTPPGQTPAGNFAVSITEVTPVGECGSGSAQIDIAFRVENTGDIVATAAMPVSFYDGNPSAGGVLLGTQVIGSPVAPGQAGFNTFRINESVDPFDLYAVANDDGTDPTNAPATVEYECDATDNVTIRENIVCKPDEDRDGVADDVEILAGWLPNDPDTDNDGLCDGPRSVEGVCVGGEDLNTNGIVDPGESDPAVNDTDNDGISDGIEVLGDNPTNPTHPDSDDDGSCDGGGAGDGSCAGEDLGEDQNGNGIVDEGETNPNDSDSDDDGLTDGVEVAGPNPTNPLDTDTDDDGLCDGQPFWTLETCVGGEDADRDGAVGEDETDPAKADTDDGGVDDDQELADGTDPTIPWDDRGEDYDGDGILNEVEIAAGLPPDDPDADDDGLCDGSGSVEGVCESGEDQNNNGIVDDGESDPENGDSDGDGLSDGLEAFADTGILTPDSDGDGLCDGSGSVEGVCDSGEDANDNGIVDTGETDPMVPDTDNDGLSDGVEVLSDNPTSPTNADSDGDGLCDGPGVGDTVCVGGVLGEDTNANGVVDNGETNPNNDDSDSDGLTDGTEVLGTNPTNPLSADSDSDGLCDGPGVGDGACTGGELGEDQNADGAVDTGETDPTDEDTDDGGVWDGAEVLADNTDPANPADDVGQDLDGDGLANDVELDRGLSPTNADSDGDGLCDGAISVAEICVAGEDLNGDGVVNDGESDPSLADTDNDGLPDGIEVLTAGTSPTNADTDNDGLCDGPGVGDGVCAGGSSGEDDGDGVVEPGETDPNNSDSDDDGILDGIEALGNTDALNPDSDGDGLCDGTGDGDSACTGGSFGEDQDNNGVVDAGETDPMDEDTDDGGVDDGTEVLTDDTDPLDAADDIDQDFDNDGVSNDDEIANDTDPSNPDSDGDGLLDGVEITEETDPNVADTDGDGRTDGEEVLTDNTDPLDADTDDDGLTDGREYDESTDPNDFDSDGDGLSDGLELGLTEPEDPDDTDMDIFVADSDPDSTTDPMDVDTDDGGISDGDEDRNGDGAVGEDETDPNDATSEAECLDDADCDGDGLTNAEELDLGTDIFDADTDGGGVSDGDEVARGSDPLDMDDDPMAVVQGGLAFRCNTTTGNAGGLLGLTAAGLLLLRRRRSALPVAAASRSR